MAMRGSSTTGEGSDRRRPGGEYGASNGGGGSVAGPYASARGPLPPPPSMTLPPPPHMGGGTDRRPNGRPGGGGYDVVMTEEEEEDCFAVSSSVSSSGYGDGVIAPPPLGTLPPPPRMSSSGRPSVPGRARRRGVTTSSLGSATNSTRGGGGGGRRRSDIASSYWARRIRSLLGMRTGKGRRRRGGAAAGDSSSSAFDGGGGVVDASSPGLRVTLAVVAWFLLGVISIATTKVLLSDVGVGPLTLSVQQFGIGTALLGVILRHRDSFIRVGGMTKSPRRTQGRSVGGLAPPPTFDAAGYASGRGVGGGAGTTGAGGDGPTMELFLTGFFFASGFVATNYSFRGSAASFVETVKAAEPITSAIVAVTWGVDTVGPSEAMSLLSVVLGVVLSTVGNSFYLGLNRHRVSGESRATSVPSLSNSVRNCLVVMIANLCFSFRGLHQKLLRSTPQGSTSVLDDVKLQYRMQQIGVGIFILPALLLECPSEIKTVYAEAEILMSGRLYRYISLSLANGFAFATYNLASTYVLTRLSVVHHAALNCVRRIFAIVVTSILFGVRLGLLGSFGVFVSFVGFMSYTRSKMKRQNKPRPLSSLLPMSAV